MPGVGWRLPSVELQAHWEGGVKPNATLGGVYVPESGEYLLWGEAVAHHSEKEFSEEPRGLNFKYCLSLFWGNIRP